MSAPHPRMHGLTHVKGGADPVPGLLPGTSFETGVLTGTEVYVTLATVNWWQGVMGRVQSAGPGIPGGAYTFAVNGPNAGIWASIAADGNVADPIAEGAVGVTLTAGMKIGLTCVGAEIRGWLYAAGTWTNILTATDSSLASGYVGLWQVQQAGRLDDFGGGPSSASLGTFTAPVLDGFDYPDEEPLSGSGNWTPRTPTPLKVVGGQVTQGGVGDHYAGAFWTPEPDGGAGDVLTVGDDGRPAWQPPGVEVEHGAGEPDENPVTTPGGAYAGFPANPSGWHYAAHTETAVLYDSAPGRFDVPSMKWVRTPFDTVRIQRRWELTVGGQFRDAWLPDDRGLTEHAKNGLLHITADMVSDTVKHIINGFFSIEYPVLDYQGLPDFTGGGIVAPDDYTRAGRVLNASTGVVLRRLPGSAQRRFMQWEWFNDADGMAVSVLYTVDNPYPIYPAWPARPLTLPQPYPQLSPTDSLAYYQTPAGNPGFNDGTFQLEQNLVAGDNLCLQAWQDSPWLLRFSTDHFPNYQPWPFVEVWRRRPFLSVTYTYDPDSVDHTTGRLL